MNSTIGRHGRTDPNAGKAMLGNRRVDHASRSEFIEETLADFIGTLIFSDLLAHEEDAIISAHFLGHGIAKRFAHGLGDHLRAGGQFRVVGDNRVAGGNRLNARGIFQRH